MVADAIEPQRRQRKVTLPAPHVVRTAAEAVHLLDDEDWLGFDIETSGLSPWTSAIAVVTLYGEQCNTAAVLHVRGGLDTVYFEEFRRWLGDPKRKYVTHNGVCFDIPFLANNGVDIFGPEWFDTMIGEAVTLKVGRHIISRSLQDTLVRRLKKELNKEHQRSIWMAEELEAEQVTYCVDDVQYLPALRRKQLDEVAKDVNPKTGDTEGTRVEAMQLEMDIIPAVLRMHHNGMPLHIPSVERYLVEQEEIAEAARATLDRYLAGINLNSYGKVLARLNEHFPDAQIPNTSAETLGVIGEFNDGPLGELARAILLHRRAKKRGSMFSEAWREQYAFNHALRERSGVVHTIPHHFPDVHWVHSRFKQLGTDTGRFSSADPNGQQIPKDARKLFGHVPGYLVVSCDYSQLEIRCAANVANDHALIEAFESEGPDSDIHTSIAALLFNKPAGDITKEERKLSKAASFTLLFGGGWRTLFNYARMSGSHITEKQAADIVTAFFMRFAGLARVRQIAYQRADSGAAYSYVMPHGLRRTFIADELTATRILNTAVQGSAAAGLKFALRLCRERHLDEYLCATVHDELVGVVPERFAEEWGNDLQQAMIDGMQLVLRRVPIKAELSVGEVWS